MDCAALIMLQAVFEFRSVRAAAKRLERPPSTVSAAVARIEQALAVPLLRAGSVPVGFALASGPLRERVALLAERLLDLAPPGLAAEAEAGHAALRRRLVWAAQRPIRFTALARYVAVVRAGSIRRAALQLGLGQPQLTRQLGQLERLLDVALLERSTGGVAPTADGRRVFDLAGPILDLWRELAAPSAHRFSRSERTVRFGAVVPLGVESRLSTLLARLIGTWPQRHRSSYLFLSCAPAEALIDGLKAGRLDAALLDIEEVPDGLEGRLVSAAPLRLVTALAAAPTPRASLAQLCASHRFALPGESTGLRVKIGRILRQQQASPGEFVEIDSVSVILRLVLDHGHVAILPADALPAYAGRLDCRPLPGDPVLAYHLLWRPTDPCRRAASEIAVVLAEAQPAVAREPVAQPAG